MCSHCKYIKKIGLNYTKTLNIEILWDKNFFYNLKLNYTNKLAMYKLKTYNTKTMFKTKTFKY